MALQSMDPSAIDALFRQACGSLQAGQWAQAETLYRELLALQPNHLGALNLLGILLTQTGRFEEAAGAMRAALDINARSEATLCNYGIVLKKLNRLSEALAAFDQALALNAAVPDTWNSRGTVLSDLQRFDDAVHDFSRAVALNPNFAEAYYNQGNALYRSGRCEPAIGCYEKAIALAPTHVSALNNCGNAYHDLKQFTRAIACYDRALAIGPDVKNTRGMRLFAKMHLCDWSDLDAERGRILSRLSEGHPATIPLALLPLSSSAADQHACARLFAADQMIRPAPRWHGARHHQRIRVGYASSDFRDHPVASLTAGMFERHDRTRFETIGISFGAEDNSAMRTRVRASFERFVSFDGTSDQAIARFIREQEIDILVDLNGYTSGARSRVFAQRPAPIQINYLGYAGTLAEACWDYIIADRFVIPESARGNFAEQVVYLPHTFMVTDADRRISSQRPARADVGLPDTGLVFCCFNNSFKITPNVFDIWMRLLHQVSGSVLWLSAADPSTMSNLRQEAEKRGVSSHRLIFAPRIPSAEDYLARLTLADLFLDTHSYNAHATACDTLWAGVPVLTCAGETFASRVAGSLLNAVGLSELITHSAEEYEVLARRLAREPDLLAAIKQKLAQNRISSALFDTDRFTRNIEAAFATMWERHQRGEAPQGFAVAEPTQS
jgi:protein O-GlcNAc transferase